MLEVVWTTYVAISKAIRRKPYRGRVPPLSSPICNGLGPHLLRPYLLRQYFLQLKSSTMFYSLDDLHMHAQQDFEIVVVFLLKDYLDDFQEVFYDVLLSGRLTFYIFYLLQNIVNNFVQKDLDKKFQKWDGDVDDPAVDNIIKVMFKDPGWKWTMNCWQVTGTHKVVKMEVSPGKNEVSPEESSRPRKKARKGSSVSAETLAAGSDGFGMTKQQIERTFKDISDAISDGFGTCLREIKLLGDRMVAVEKKVGITKKGLCLVRPADELPSDDPSVVILDKQVSTASDLLLEEARRQTKKKTAMVNLREKSERERKLAPTQQTPFKGNSTAKQIIPNKKVGRGYDPFASYDKKKSKELTEWVQQDPYLLFANLRRVLGGGVDVDDIYAPVNFKNQHWIAIWISIPKRHIVVWDSIISHISREELDEVMEPLFTMVAYLLVECALSDEQKVQYTLEPYTYARQTDGVPQCRAGDCGPFALKYTECHALGMEFPKAFNKRNGKTIRENMAVDIFQEFPMCHEWENQDKDDNLGMYE
ncbi:unnamed protein product [Brassica napus]|uniref:(rape) hypothetical protein n=1 Tax=Brassica napus TaxID=3708 RepID=A0A816WHD3_BRANA|nr:unnamed protein product [Brassica napus]